MAFGQSLTILVDDQRTVIPGRLRQPQRATNQDLACRRSKQVGAADHFGDRHRGIVDGDGELIGGHSIFTPDEEVAEVFSGNEALWPEMAVVELDCFSVLDAEAPVDPSVKKAISQNCVIYLFPAAISRINRLVVVGSLGQSCEVLSCATAGIDEPSRD